LFHLEVENHNCLGRAYAACATHLEAIWISIGFSEGGVNHRGADAHHRQSTDGDAVARISRRREMNFEFDPNASYLIFGMHEVPHAVAYPSMTLAITGQ
jgi:hypothetical protein